MPTINTNATNVSEETDDILSRIPSWIVRALTMTIILITVFGAMLLTVFSSIGNGDGQISHVKVYPKMAKIQLANLSRIDHIYQGDGTTVTQGDTIAQVLDLQSSKSHYIISEHDGKLLLRSDLREGQVVQENAVLGTVLAEDVTYQILGRALLAETHTLSTTDRINLYSDTTRMTGQLVGSESDHTVIYSIPPTEDILRQLMENDSLTLRVQQKSRKIPFL